MRRAIIVAITAALVTAIVASWGTTVITGHSPKNSGAAMASKPIDVMQMMKDAKDLPEEKYDAY